MILKRTSAALAALSLAAGCTVGPDYHAPVIATPPVFAGPQPATPGNDIDPATWWVVFGDPELDGLVTRALKGNPNIAIAASRVRQARLQEIIAHASDKPTIDATADVTHIEFSKNAGLSSIAQAFSGGSGTGGSTGGGAGGSGGSSGSGGGIALPGSGITTYSAGFDASWEIDLFGGARRGVEAANASAEAAVWNQRDAAVTLAAEVAQAYFALRLDQEQAAVIQQEIERQRGSLDIAGQIAKVGLVPQIDVTRQRGSITATIARLQPIQADTQVRIHALGILLGAQPEALTQELSRPAPPLGAPPIVPPGLPSDLLRRRPDVRAAERNLAAATADIGVAVADLYPKLTLTGIGELISTALSTLVTGDSLQLTGTAAAQFPILDWGRRKATIGLRKEDREQAYINYQTVVLGALRDVEDPLSQLDGERRRNDALKHAVADAETTAKSVEARYRAGFVAQDSLLDAQAQVLNQREQLAASDTQLRLDTAALFKAIGGGWSDAEPSSSG